jgi:hypothetical protein
MKLGKLIVEMSYETETIMAAERFMEPSKEINGFSNKIKE